MAELERWVAGVTGGDLDAEVRSWMESSGQEKAHKQQSFAKRNQEMRAVAGRGEMAVSAERLRYFQRLCVEAQFAVRGADKQGPLPAGEPGCEGCGVTEGRLLGLRGETVRFVLDVVDSAGDQCLRFTPNCTEQIHLMDTARCTDISADRVRQARACLSMSDMYGPPQDEVPGRPRRGTATKRTREWRAPTGLVPPEAKVRRLNGFCADPEFEPPDGDVACPLLTAVSRADLLHEMEDNAFVLKRVLEVGPFDPREESSMQLLSLVEAAQTVHERLTEHLLDSGDKDMSKRVSGEHHAFAPPAQFCEWSTLRTLHDQMKILRKETAAAVAHAAGIRRKGAGVCSG